ncbi:MAG: cyclic nucleotide-binding domain-containing protein [Rubrivivax sp.]|nr:cyclic nucleotide-binding domain-containing protein [Pyrinomonadaceae bacterium]
MPAARKEVKPALDLTELEGLLKDTTVLSILSSEDLTRFADRVTLVHYTLGQPICRAGEVADAFYVVYSGRARVLAASDGTETTVGLLTRGNYFGEQGLLTDSRRHFTVRAASDLTLLRLSREDFDALVGQHPELQDYFRTYISETSVRNFLKLCTVLSPLSPAEIRDLLGALKAMSFDAGQFIIREGETGDAFYILREGSAEVVKETEGGKVLKRLKAGDAFGELALLTGQKRAASVVTREATSVFRLEKEDFDRIIATAPKVKEAVVQMASGYSKLAVSESSPGAMVEPPPTEELPDAPEPEAETNGYRPRRARRYPALMQLSEMDCGAACMAMILRYYRKHVSINRLRDLVNVSREGATLYSVAEGAERLGFHARGIRASYDHLAKVELPAIAHWEGYHYIVLYEANPDYVIVADPAIGRRRLSRAEFEKGWTGYLLLMQPTPRIEGVEESRTTFGRFLTMLKPYRKLLFEILLD